MSKRFTFIDLFAGAGGLSEGFIRAGFEPVAHVEIDHAAANTLKTRAAYHWLQENNFIDIYDKYLKKELTRDEFWSTVPEYIQKSVINLGIGDENNPKIFEIIDSLANEDTIDLIIGGPPCQAYSIAGRSRDKNGMVGDHRNFLYKYYADFLERYKPTYFVFENVLGLLSAKDIKNQSYFTQMKNLFREKGYETEYRIIDASEFGIPQKRKRIILIGKLGEKPDYPDLIESECPISINEFLSDLPVIQAGGGQALPTTYKKDAHSYLSKCKIRNNERYVTWHVARPNNQKDLNIYQRVVKLWDKDKIRLKYTDIPKKLQTHKNTTAHLDRFKVVAGDKKYSHTVVAHIAKDGHYYIHPDINQNRSLTPREAARIQTFPDDYYFEGVSDRPSRTAAFKQIGNAVPVLLGEKIAHKLKSVW